MSGGRAATTPDWSAHLGEGEAVLWQAPYFRFMPMLLLAGLFLATLFPMLQATSLVVMRFFRLETCPIPMGCALPEGSLALSVLSCLIALATFCLLVILGCGLYREDFALTATRFLILRRFLGKSRLIALPRKGLRWETGRNLSLTLFSTEATGQNRKVTVLAPKPRDIDRLLAQFPKRGDA